MCVGVHHEHTGLGLVHKASLESGEFIDLGLYAHDSRFNVLERTPGAHFNTLLTQ